MTIPRSAMMRACAQESKPVSMSARAVAHCIEINKNTCT